MPSALLLVLPVDVELLKGIDGTKRLTVVRCCLRRPLDGGRRGHHGARARRAAACGAFSMEAVEGSTLLTVPVPGALLLAAP